MPITHTTVKIAGNKLFAVSDWNADHTGTLNHLTELANVGVNTHAQIDTHITDTTNPHSVTLQNAYDAGSSIKFVDDTHIIWDLDRTAGEEEYFLIWNKPTNKEFLKIGIATTGIFWMDFASFNIRDSTPTITFYDDGNLSGYIYSYDTGSYHELVMDASTGNNVAIVLGDDAGSNQFNIYNSSWGIPFSVDSVGNVYAAGNVGIGTATPAVSAILDLTSTTGALLVPRMTTAEKAALTAINGMIVYDTTLNKFQGYENGAWTSFI